MGTETERGSSLFVRFPALWALSLLLFAAPLLAGESIVGFRSSSGKSLCRFSVEIARTSQEQERGLMFRQSLDRGTGMFFVYDVDGPRHFWMKNTLIPLDLVFIDSKLKVVDIYANARPLDEHIISSGFKAQYVLEISAGAAAACGIKIGTAVRLQNITR
jgi:uncharacterized protein